MSELRAQLREWRAAVQKRLPPWWSQALAGLLIVIGIVLPFLFSSSSAFMNATIIAIAYAVMSLGLNVVVGFAGLLDLGYVAFYALGAYSLNWLGSGFFFKAQGPRARLAGREDAARRSSQLHPDPDRGRAHLRRGRSGDRAADAAPARRLHRDRDARVRRDHRRAGGQRPERPRRRRHDADPSATGASASARSTRRISPGSGRSTC